MFEAIFGYPDSAFLEDYDGPIVPVLTFDEVETTILE